MKTKTKKRRPNFATRLSNTATSLRGIRNYRKYRGHAVRTSRQAELAYKKHCCEVLCQPQPTEKVRAAKRRKEALLRDKRIKERRAIRAASAA